MRYVIDDLINTGIPHRSEITALLHEVNIIVWDIIHRTIPVVIELQPEVVSQLLLLCALQIKGIQFLQTRISVYTDCILIGF